MEGQFESLSKFMGYGGREDFIGDTLRGRSVGLLIHGFSVITGWSVGAMGEYPTWWVCPLNYYKHMSRFVGLSDSSCYIARGEFKTKFFVGRGKLGLGLTRCLPARSLISMDP